MIRSVENPDKTKDDNDRKLIEPTLDSKLITQKHQSPLRWLILLLSSLLLCGDYYSYDTPYACKELLGEQLSQYSQQEYQYLFNLLYTVYQIPNIFLPFINGFITDKVKTCFMSFFKANIWNILVAKITYTINEIEFINNDN